MAKLSDKDLEKTNQAGGLAVVVGILVLIIMAITLELKLYFVSGALGLILIVCLLVIRDFIFVIENHNLAVKEEEEEC